MKMQKLKFKALRELATLGLVIVEYVSAFGTYGGMYRVDPQGLRLYMRRDSLVLHSASGDPDDTIYVASEDLVTPIAFYAY